MKLNRRSVLGGLLSTPFLLPIAKCFGLNRSNAAPVESVKEPELINESIDSVTSAKIWFLNRMCFLVQNKIDNSYIRKRAYVDNLNVGDLARYDRQDRKIYVMCNRFAKPDLITDGEEVLVPTFEIASEFKLPKSLIMSRKEEDNFATVIADFFIQDECRIVEIFKNNFVNGELIIFVRQKVTMLTTNRDSFICFIEAGYVYAC